MSDDFPDDVRCFLTQVIDSVEQLETLLLLCGDPQHAWSADAVGHALYTSPQAAELRLASLHARGLIEAQGKPATYRYRPPSTEANALIARLADLYRERRVTVVGLIYSHPSGPAHAFADAFRLRKEKKDN